MTLVNINVKIGNNDNVRLLKNGNASANGVFTNGTTNALSANHDFISLNVDTTIEVREVAGNAVITNNHVNGQDVTGCARVFLEVSEKDSLAAILLVKLKQALAGNIGEVAKERMIMLRNIDDTKVIWGTGNTHLVIKNFSIDNIDINVIDNTVGTGGGISDTDKGARTGNDLKLWREKLLKVVEIEQKGYDDYKDLPDVMSDDLKIAVACKDGTSAPGKNGVDASAYANPTAAAADEGKKIYQTAYHLASVENSGADTTENLKANIDLLVKRLAELEIAKKVIGLETIDELLMLNAAAFTIRGNNRADGTTAGTIADPTPLNFAVQNDHTKGANPYDKDNFATWKTVKDFFPNGDKIYRDFDVLDLIKKEGKVKLDSHTANDDDAHIFSRRVQANGTIYTKTNLDALRAVKVAADANNGVNNKPEKKKVFENFGNKSDPKDLWGFLPGDILTNAYNTHNVTGWTSMNTKIGFNIQDATTKDVIVKAAFIDPDFEEVNWGYVPKLDPTEDKKSETEFVSSRAELVDNYYASIKIGGKGVWKPKDGGKPRELPHETDEDTKEIEEDYQAIRQLAEIFDYTYKSDGSDKSKAQTDKAIIEDWKEEDPTDPVRKRLKNTSLIRKNVSRLISKLNEINAAITDKKIPQGGKIKDTDVDTARDKAVKALTFTDADFKAAIKKVFDDNKDDELVGKDKALLTELENLVKKVDEAFKDGTKVEKKDLEDNYKNNNADANKKKAWELLNKIKYKNKNLGDEAITKAKRKPQTNDLETAKQAAKTRIEAKMTNGGTEAYNAMILNNSDIKTKAQVEKVAEIFEKCYEAWGKSSSDDYASFKTALEKFKTSNSTEWKAVNKFQKNNNNEAHTAGFAAGALAHLASFVKSREKELEAAKALGVKNKTEALKAAEELEKSADNVNKEKVAPRLRLIAELFEKGGDASKLAEKIRDNLLKKVEDEYSDDSHKDNLEKLKNLWEELKVYYKDGKNKEFYTNLNQANKTTFDTLMTGLKSKVEAMEKKSKEGGGNKEEKPTETPFWKSGWGIALIFVIVLAVLGGIAWLIKANSSSEDEGTGE